MATIRRTHAAPREYVRGGGPLRTLQTVRAAYLLLFANFGAFLIPALFWTLLTTAARALTFATDSAAIGDGEILVRIGPYLLGLIFAAAGSICMGIVWHRSIILGEPVRRIVPTTNDVIGPYTVRAIASMILPIALYILVAAIYHQDSDNLVVTAIAYAGTSIILARLGRLLLVLPASAVGDKVTTVRVSLRTTRGRNTAIFLGLLAVDLPWNALAFAIESIFTAPGDETIESIAAFAVTQCLDLARVVTWTAFISYAYLEFIRPTQMQADQFS
jgi:hypothetical protein